MARATRLAGLGWPAPNPRVGCVLVKDGRIVGEGHHERRGGPHAEAVALAAAGIQARGATAYVTLEPCDHHGLTPPCSAALLEAGVTKVVCAEPDPNPGARGGTERLRQAGVEVIHEPYPEAAEVNVAFLTAHRKGRAYCTVKAALTADGFMAREDGTSQWITGELARAAGHGLRAEAGAVLVGAGTAVFDRPKLTVRAFETGWQPQRFVIDPRRRVDPGSPLFEGDPAVRVVAADDARDSELGIARKADGLDLQDLLVRLLERGVTSVLVEGGPVTIRRFADAGLVDRLDLFVAPTRFGAGASLAVSAGLELRRVRALGDDGWATYVRPGEGAAFPYWDVTLRS